MLSLDLAARLPTADPASDDGCVLLIDRRTSLRTEGTVNTFEELDLFTGDSSYLVFVDYFDVTVAETDRAVAL